MEFWKLNLEEIKILEIKFERNGILKIIWELEFRKLNSGIEVLKINWESEFWKLILRIGNLEN